MTELEHNQKLALTVRERIENSTQYERTKILDDLLDKWVIKDSDDENIIYFLHLALGNFSLTVNDLQFGTFEKAKKIAIYEVSYLRLVLENDDDLDEDEIDIIREKTNKIFKSIVDSENAIRSILHLQGSMIDKETGTEENPDIMRFTPIDFSNNTQYQDLLLFLLEHLMRKGYRRYKDTDEKNQYSACYKRIYTKEGGYDTHAWEKAMSLKDFVYDVCRMKTNYSMWQNLTSAKNNIQGAQEYLSDFLGGEFEDIHRDRHIFSFNNGIYITKKWDEENEIFKDEWVPYSSANKLGATIVSCKYFDQDFDESTREYDNWWDIIVNHCPAMKKIMDYQEWPEEVQKWMCIVLGRTLYDIREIGEDWQIIGYLLGIAGTGKSNGFDTPVMLNNGEFKMIQDIKTGDKLMGDDSKPRTVLATSKAKEKLYRVKQVKGDDYIVNGDHILSLKLSYTQRSGTSGKLNKYKIINGSKYEKGDIIDISVNDYLKLSKGAKKSIKGYKVPITFEKKYLQIDPYIIGAWLGDGTSGNSGFTNQDAAILKYLANKLPEYDCYLNHKNNKSNMFQYDFRSIINEKNNYVKQVLRDLNLINNKHIPDIYKYNSRDNQLKILAGLLDTDGWYDKKSNCYEIIQKNKRLSYDIQYIARCLGFSATVKKCKKSCVYKGEKRVGTYYRQHIGGIGIEEIPCLIKRKQAVPRKTSKNNLHTGITIEPVEQEYYDQGPEYHYRYSIQIDGNQRFILGDHTVTHNSSIITKIAANFYEGCDVGTMSNNMEKTFGLGALSEKFVYIAPEIKGDFSMEQSEFQSIISGEQVQIAIKHKTAESITWKVPGIMAGNEVMQYTDNAGSISRRLMVFKFNISIREGDGDSKLNYKLKNEIPYILQASNKAYLEKVIEAGDKQIWDILPEYFKKSRDEMAENTNALTNFLKSDKVIIKKGLYIKEKDFLEAFTHHCIDTHLGRKQWTNQYYLGPFSMLGIIFEKSARYKYPIGSGRYSNGNFILNVDVLTEFDNRGNIEDDFDSGEEEMEEPIDEALLKGFEAS